ELLDWYEELVNTYPIYSIEDGLHEDDWDAWGVMAKMFENRIQIVGDDLFATNINRISHAAEQKMVAGVIIKPNQIGTITEALQAIKLCQNYGLTTIVSHRSGETDD